MLKEIHNPISVFGSENKINGGWSREPLLKFNEYNYKKENKIDHRQCFFAENDTCSFYIALEKTGVEFIIKVIIRDKIIVGTASDCIVKKFILNKRNMPDLLSDKVYFQDNRIKFALSTQNNRKHLRCQFKDFAEFNNLYFDFTFNKKQGDHLNLSVPFKNNKNFYYKSFTPNVFVSGQADFGDKSYSFDNAYGFCDSTSYVLPYRQIYKCVTASCNINGKDFALYFGSKLGDDVSGEENLYFHNGNLQKLSKIKFLGTDERIDKPWGFKAGIKAVDVTFIPKTHCLAPIFTKCDKTTVVYGSLYGEFSLLDKEPVILTDVPATMFYTVI